MFSIYSSVYNLEFFKIDPEFILKNWSEFLQFNGEIVISVNDPDGTDEFTVKKIESIAENLKCPVKIVHAKIPFTLNTFDGDLKNLALQNCNERFPLKIQMDFDEIFQESARGQWNDVGEKLLNSVYEAVFIPSVDLYGSKEKIRKNHNIGQKWRIHKNGLKRGVWNEAKLPGGLFDTSKSDSCELLDSFGFLVPAINITPKEFLTPEYCHNLRNYIYTLHLGYLDLNRRSDLNKNWWSEKWSDRSGHKENVVTSVAKLKKEEIVEHHLETW